jgi:uncharacterized protein GlcG (DUF336 family)
MKRRRHDASRSPRGRGGARRLAAPERLEGRNAPGGLTPFSPGEPHALPDEFVLRRDEQSIASSLDETAGRGELDRDWRVWQSLAHEPQTPRSPVRGRERLADFRMEQLGEAPSENTPQAPSRALTGGALGSFRWVDGLGSVWNYDAARHDAAAAAAYRLAQPYATTSGGGASGTASPTPTGGGGGGRTATGVPQFGGDGGMAPASAALAPAALAETSPPPEDSGHLAVAMNPPATMPPGLVLSLALSPTSDSVPATTTPPDPGPVPPGGGVSIVGDPGEITAAEVNLLLSRAARATSRNDAIIAIVDRNGRILGVHVEGGVTAANQAALVFAIDGAVAKARTAAFFSSDAAPLPSRTVRFISQTTITEREVEANPNSADPLVKGPGFVAPIGVGGHFPPDVTNTPPVDLFAIEHTNRDSLVHPGPDRIRQAATLNPDGTIIAPGGDDIDLNERFGATYIAGQEISAPESYGFVSNTFTQAQSRGIATLPGGVPLYNANGLVGGIGVFFPGPDGYATFEQGFVPGVGQTTTQRTNAPLVIEAEYTAALVAKNSTVIGGIPPVPGFSLPPEESLRIDLVGITLENFGPHPGSLSDLLARPFSEGPETGSRQPVTPTGDLAIGGLEVPEGWIVAPTASTFAGGLTALEVEQIILRGVDEANLVRAAIRKPLGSRTRMVLSVTDLDGTVLGLFRMPDATVFSLDVAVAKARNVTYYVSPGVNPVDLADAAHDGTPDLPWGIAFTNRTFRFLAEPRFPSGIDGTPGSFSTLFVPGVDMQTAENIGGVPPSAAAFGTTVLGFDAFNPGSNFHEPVSADGFQNGVVFFPGSTPLFRGTSLVGGLGVSGDGVDQDDVVTFVAAGEFLPRIASPVTRADEVFLAGVRLPYQKFLRNPHG